MTIAHDSFLIGGGYLRADSSERVTTRSAVTGDLLGSFPKATRTDIDRAVEAARAPSDWHRATAAQRAVWMRRLADAIDRRADEMGALIAQEVGTPVELATTANGYALSERLRYYADLAAVTERIDERDGVGVRTLVRRVPMGVVGMIIPWNYPIGLIGYKLGPALATGCTAVIKPSPETGLDSYLLADAVLEAGFPPGVINIVPADRSEGEYLVQHPGVDKISFTGSSAAGMRVGGLCGSLLKPVTLELGGKSAAVLLDDADLDGFLAAVPQISLRNNGQTCLNNTRILAPRSRYDEVLDAVAGFVGALTVGDPQDPSTDIGPLVAERQRDRVEGYIASGLAEGGRLLLGGARATKDAGWFVQPTVLADIEPQTRIFQEEIFGPVLTVTAYDGGDEGAVAMANDSQYGLAGTVWSPDEERGLGVATRIETGTIGVNVYRLSINAPFEGWKHSGLGRELGPEALELYWKYQSVSLSPKAGAA